MRFRFRHSWMWLVIATFILSFQNCAGNGLQTYSSLSESTSATIASSAQTLTSTAVNVRKDGSGICNSVAFAQVPGQVNYFVGRVLQESSPGKCDSEKWGLGLFKMDWSSNTLNFQKYLLQPSATESAGYKITSAYDPHIVSFNSEIWMAFECTGEFGYTASSCVAPFTISGGIDFSRMTLTILGDRTSDRQDAYSASVPKLLVYNGKLYIYWSACHFEIINGEAVFVQVTSRGAQLVQESSGLKRMWVKNSVGTPLFAYDTNKSDEVFGTNTADPSANSLGDTFDFFTDGSSVYAVVGVGNTGCVTPLSPLFGCYHVRITQSASPLGYHIFNNNFLNSVALPANPQEYARLYKDPNGGTFMMGQFLNPVLNGTAKAANTLPAGYQKFPVNLSGMKFTSSTISDGLVPSPNVNVANLDGKFSILRIYHRACVSTHSTAVDCAAAVSRFCQGQGYATGTGILQHVNDDASFSCVGYGIAKQVEIQISQLTAVHSYCTINRLVSDSCQSATEHYCRNNGYAGGFGPQEVSGNTLLIACIKTGHAAQINTSFTALKAIHPGCSQTSAAASDSCRSAADNLCKSKGYNSGYGIVDDSGDSATVGCLK